MRRVLLLVALVGVALFGGTLLLSWLDPLMIEKAAREVVRIEVEKRVGEKIDALSNSKVAALAAKALGRTDVELARKRRELQQGLPAKVAQATADLLRVDCECRRRLVERATQSAESELASLEKVQAKLLGMIETAYASTTRDLMRELRIVCACNAAMFVLLGMLAWRRQGATLQLLLPAAVLLGAVGLTGTLYLVEQDWLHTLIFGDYVGWGYLGYLALAAALLCDVAFNRARAITFLLNRVFSSFGSAVSLVPC